jgi:hypothetical protein
MEWVAPDTAATPPPVPPPAEPMVVPPSAKGIQPRRLGPQTTADILDGAFAVIKRAPATIIGLAAVFVIPAQLLATWMANKGTSSVDPFAVFSGDTSYLTAEDTTNASGTLWIYAAILPSTMALVFVAAGIARLISAWQVGHDLTLGEILKGLLPRTWALVASALLVKLMEAIGLVLCTVPGLAVMALCLVTVPAIAAEQLGPIAGIQRSWRLVKRRFWAVLGIGVLVGIVSELFSNALQALPTILVFFTGGSSDVSWPILGALSSLSSLLTVPMVGAAAMLTYLDLRVRTEGLDLELEAIDLLPTAVATAP